MIVTLLIACSRTAAPPVPAVADAPEPEQAHRHAPNDRFTSPEVDVDAWAARFESADREVFEHRDAIVATLGLAPGHAVADIGAGTGAMLEPLVSAVGPDGTVYATELSPSFREHLAARAEERGWTQVTVVPSAVDATGLPDASVDAALLVDVYHHLEAPADFVADVARALKPGGSLVVVDFDPGREGASEWVREHVFQTAEEVRAQVVGTGHFTAEPDPEIDLVDNRLLRFVKTR